MSSKNPKWNSLGDFLKAKEEKEREIQEQSLPDSQQPSATMMPATPVTTVTTVTPVTPVAGEAAPKRDFTRTPNSIVREAIPAGVFTGKCKQLYDYLYSQTRGAIVPARSARIPTERVMRGAGMTRHTFRAHIHRLISFGLIVVEEKPGEHGGNVYTVLLPEEAEDRTNRGHTGDRGDRGHTGDKVPVVQGSQAHPCDRGLSPDFSTGSSDSKTLFKTNTESDDDDAALRGLFSVLKELNQEMTGKPLSQTERERWRELGEVLRTEAKIAGARTTVSSLPAFLAEHLRRRLWKKDKRQIEAERSAPASEQGTAARLTPEQIKSCPDCNGTLFFYAKGYDQPVERCRHEKLRSLQEGKQSDSQITT